MLAIFVVINISACGKSERFIKVLYSALSRKNRFFAAELSRFFQRCIHNFAAEPVFSVLRQNGNSADLVSFAAVLGKHSCRARGNTVFIKHKVKRIFIDIVKFILKFLLFNKHFLPYFGRLFGQAIMNFYAVHTITAPILALIFDLFNIILYIACIFITFVVKL